MAYELALRVEVRAVAKIFWRAAARTPGVDATGRCGGGEGDADVRDGIMWLYRLLLQKYCMAWEDRNVSSQ